MGLVRISRIDAPEAMLLSPEQTFFVRENIKLKLLNARLGLLARQYDAARSDMTHVSAAVRRYADGQSRKTQQMLALLEQAQQQLQGTPRSRTVSLRVGFPTASMMASASQLSAENAVSLESFVSDRPEFRAISASVSADGVVTPGDIISAVEGTPVDTVAKLMSRLDDFSIGGKVKLTVQRGAVKSEVLVTLEAQR